MLPELSTLTWAVLGLAAFTVGISKSAIPALGTLAVVMGAAVLPARESTGVLLVMFLLGDVFAVWTYRRDANWAMLRRLAPAVVGGVLLGALFLAFADDRGTAIAIGVILIFLIGLTLYQRWKGAEAPAGNARIQGTIYGTLGGFTTMVANAGGPAMSLYFLAERLKIMTFLGTAAWFFALTNLFKLPFSIGLGLINGPSLVLNAALLPAIIAGFICGRLVISRIDQRLFDRLVLLATMAGAAYLVIDGLWGG